MKFKRFDFQSVTSTNDVAALDKYTHGSLITAVNQSAGRGQRGNKWHSVQGENLTFSLVVEPTHIEVGEQFHVSMIASLAVASTIAHYGIEARVKWPNDIYVKDRKICGILIENSFSSQFLDKSIIGIGINVLQTQFDEWVANPVSLALLGVQGVTPNDVLEIFCQKFSTLYSLALDQIHTLYMSSLYRGEGFSLYRDANGEFSARIASIDPAGGVLTLERSQGELSSYYFKEIEFVQS